MARQVKRLMVEGREIFICDSFADADTAVRVGLLLKTLTYTRTERSRDDTPVSGTAAPITDDLLASEPYVSDRFFFTLRTRADATSIRSTRSDCNSDLAILTFSVGVKETPCVCSPSRKVVSISWMCLEWVGMIIDCVFKVAFRDFPLTAAIDFL